MAVYRERESLDLPAWSLISYSDLFSHAFILHPLHKTHGQYLSSIKHISMCDFKLGRSFLFSLFKKIGFCDLPGLVWFHNPIALEPDPNFVFKYPNLVSTGSINDGLAEDKDKKKRIQPSSASNAQQIPALNTAHHPRTQAHTHTLTHSNTLRNPALRGGSVAVKTRQRLTRRSSAGGKHTVCRQQQQQ